MVTQAGMVCLCRVAGSLPTRLGQPCGHGHGHGHGHGQLIRTTSMPMTLRDSPPAEQVGKAAASVLWSTKFQGRYEIVWKHGRSTGEGAAMHARSSSWAPEPTGHGRIRRGQVSDVAICLTKFLFATGGGRRVRNCCLMSFAGA